MTLSRHVFDATGENFSRLVLENSHRGPVLVHFWTPKAGPCMILMPRLVRLATEYGGRFLLVMLNTDDWRRLAREYGVNSVPTVKFFLRGEVVHTIHGAESDRTFREALDRYITKSASTLQFDARVALVEGDFEGGKKLLAAAAVEQPDNPRIPLDLAKTLWISGERETALTLLESVPPGLKNNPGIQRLRAHFLLSMAAEQPGNADSIPETSGESRFRQVARRLVQDDYATALALLAELATEQPDFRNGLPRAAMDAILELLGPDHVLTQQYRNGPDSKRY